MTQIVKTEYGKFYRHRKTKRVYKVYSPNVYGDKVTGREVMLLQGVRGLGYLLRRRTVNLDVSSLAWECDFKGKKLEPGQVTPINWRIVREEYVMGSGSPPAWENSELVEQVKDYLVRQPPLTDAGRMAVDILKLIGGFEP